MTRLFSRYFYGGIIYVTSAVLVSLSSLIRAPLIINKLDISTYGIYILVISTLPTAISLLSLGSGFLARRYLPSSDSRHEIQDLFIPQFYFRLAIIIPICLIILIFSKFIELPFIPNKSFLIGIVVFFFLYYFYDQILDYFRYTHRIKTSSAVGMIYNYIFITFIFIFSYSGNLQDINSLILAHIIALLLTLFPLYAKALSEINFFPKKYKESGELKRDIVVGFPFILNNLNESVINIGDRYILGILISTAAVGFYTPAYSIGCLLLILARGSNTLLPPLISKQFDENNKDSVSSIITLFTKFYVTLSLGFFIGCICYGFDFLKIYINQEFAKNSLSVLIIIAFSSIFSGMNLIFSNIFYIELKTRFMLIVNVCGTFFNVLANLVLILIFNNMEVAAITTFLTFILVFIIYLLNVKSYLKFGFNLINLVKVIAPSILIILTSLSMQNKIIYIQNFYVKVIISSLLFLLTLVALERKTIQDLYKILRNRT